MSVKLEIQVESKRLFKIDEIKEGGLYLCDTDGHWPYLIVLGDILIVARNLSSGKLDFVLVNKDECFGCRFEKISGSLKFSE